MRAPLITVGAAVAVIAGGGLLASGAASGAPTVGVEDFSFTPASTSVKRGSTVTFRWTGSAPHNVTVTSGPVKFHSPTQKKGTYKRKLTRKGTYSFKCTLHPFMKGRLRVK